MTGGALIEIALVMVPFLVFTLGSAEYLWYINVRQSVNAAAEEGARVVAVDHNEIVTSTLGGSSQSLDPLRSIADSTVKNFLTNLGFNNEFVSSIQVSIDYLKNLQDIDPRLAIGGIPQKDKMRLVGVVVTVPAEKAMIFGNIVSKFLQLASSPPEDLKVIVLMWKHWKD